ncbi:MAG: TIGR04282 family arsenosugar biosynthesis glycosyltransferase [Saprospiraceae bacterium]|nr:TIGR04282 family arsenosugar biosynthesis glycosyltransferase [Saprospiraceae bacterium]
MNQLIIFIKNPELGKVKTRLAYSVGDQKALDIYLRLINITLDVTSRVDAERYLYYDRYVDSNDVWSNDRYKKKLQQGQDLGKRMTNAFEEVFTFGQFFVKKKVIIIGSDCAELTTELIHSAFDLLENYDTVIGPSMDGGYYLLGMTTFNKLLFEDILWSSEGVFEETIRKMEHQKLTYKLMPILNDIDTIDDWNQELLRLQSGNI